tara:strand:- start:262 stop:474 length:213 start_codon:yes stop_codon:yes gene_type:complete
MNERLKKLIGLAMYEKGLSKIDISDLMNWSYPTALKKINKPGTLKISEAERLCKMLNLNFNEFLNNNSNE